MSKNTIGLWYDKDAEAAARFYAETFPDSAVGAVHRAPSDYPSGKEGDVLTVEFTVLGVPCLGLNGGPVFKHNESSRSRSRPKTRKRLIDTGTQLLRMVGKRASAGGAKTTGEFPGRSRRAC